LAASDETATRGPRSHSRRPAALLVRVSAHRDRVDRRIVITGIGRSWSLRSGSWSGRSVIVIAQIGHRDHPVV